MKQNQAVQLYRHAGQRIKDRRKALRVTQGQLADMLGISYQQVQKYEAGLNQLSLGRLLQFAKVMNVTPDFFYEGVSLDEQFGKAIEGDVIQRDRGRPLQFLLVEDNLHDAMLFNKALEDFEADVAVHCISESESVMDYLQSYATKYGKPAPDIVILDLNLPKINGMQLLKSIKENSQTALLPVLILTNSISKKEMLEAYRLGASGFIQKSVNFADYKESIVTVVHYWSKVVALPVK